MKKVIFSASIFLMIFGLSSCFWSKTKYEELPVEKQAIISEEVKTKISKKMEKVDMSDFTSENVNEEKVKELREKLDEIVKSSINEVKKEQWDFDSTLLENRLLDDEISKVKN